ncbi:cation diffusion facilitator family transporter [Tumidithrix helvetica PCC 7403]|uniref:cation diffusion facilitator family transporter n=1 Tax=Tumidithrix helvetica TaxID=3457545 RepID=UPI003CB7CCDE
MEDTRPQVRRVLVITLLLNLIVLATKALVGWATGSLSLIADALHSITDSASNVIGLVAIQFASPHPDRDHPYGHQKFESVAALGISAFLGIACFEIFKGVIDRIMSGGRPVTISAPALWLMLFVLGLNIFTTLYERHVGEKIGSPILIADAQHTMSDVWVTITVIAGLVGVWTGNVTGIVWLQWLDVIMACPVAILVFWSGWKVLRNNLPMLVDEMAIAPEEIDAIARQVSGVINCHDIASRGIVGQQVFIEMHMIVAPADVESAHQITEAVEERLHDRFDPARITIHVEPPDYHSDRVTYS